MALSASMAVSMSCGLTGCMASITWINRSERATSLVTVVMF